MFPLIEIKNLLFPTLGKATKKYSSFLQIFIYIYKKIRHFKIEVNGEMILKSQNITLEFRL